jgi:hypothetical protein
VTRVLLVQRLLRRECAADSGCHVRVTATHLLPRRKVLLHRAGRRQARRLEVQVYDRLAARLGFVGVVRLERVNTGHVRHILRRLRLRTCVMPGGVVVSALRSETDARQWGWAASGL